ARLFGTTHAQALGKTHWELFPDAVGTELERRFRKVLQNRRSAIFEYKRSSQPRRLDVSVAPGPWGGISECYREMESETERDSDEERAEDKEALAGAFHQLKIFGFARLDAHGRILDSNAEFLRMLVL